MTVREEIKTKPELVFPLYVCGVEDDLLLRRRAE